MIWLHGVSNPGSERSPWLGAECLIQWAQGLQYGKTMSPHSKLIRSHNYITYNYHRCSNIIMTLSELHVLLTMANVCTSCNNGHWCHGFSKNHEISGIIDSSLGVEFLIYMKTRIIWWIAKSQMVLQLTCVMLQTYWMLNFSIGFIPSLLCVCLWACQIC